MSLSCFLDFISGLGMFLYGMNILSESLGHLAGSRVQGKLQQAAKSPIKAVMLGAGVTGIIQSSTATTMMCIGLLNSGILNIYEALPVIMGAGIGSTVTGQLLRFGDFSGRKPLLYLFDPTVSAPFFVLIGAVEKLFFKRIESKKTADIFIGSGILFIGMKLMEGAAEPLAQSENFRNLLLSLNSPLTAVIFGAFMTTVIQSSSASIGILQSLSVTNAITLSAAIPIILGINVGKVIPEFIATLGASKNTARTIFAELTVNIASVIITFFFVFSAEAIIKIPFWHSPATRGMIANLHTVFNVFTTITLLPFYRKIITLTEKIIK